MTNIMSNISLRFKINLIGAIGVLGLIIVAAIYFASRVAQDGIEATMDVAANAEAATRQVELQLLQARSAEKDFLLRHQTSYLDLHTATMRDVDAWLAKVAHCSAPHRRRQPRLTR
jgi:methyl-accepting chemotaxis protein